VPGERTREALEAWLATFSDTPSFAIYQTINRLAGREWKKLKPEVMVMLE